MSQERRGSITKRKFWSDKIHETFSVQNFIKAVDVNDIALVETYLNRGQNPNAHMGNYVTPLHICAMHGFDYLTSILLEHPDIDVNSLDHVFRTPLSRACKYRNYHNADLLLQHHANSNTPDRLGYTPIHHAALWGWEDIIQLLLKYEANLNVINAFGKTPLHIVCIDSPSISMIRLLCNNGADVDLCSETVMPVLLACCLNCFDYEGLDIIDLLIYFDADVNLVYEANGQTALHMAAITGFVPLAEILCTAGANPDIMDNLFRTPYDLALQMQNQEMIEFLRMFFVDILPTRQIMEVKKSFRSLSMLVTKNKRKKHYETF